MHNIIDVNARERALLKSLALSSLPSGDSESLEEVVTDLENPSPLRKYPTMYNQLSNKNQNGEEKYLGSSSVKATKGEKATQEMLQSEENMPLSARGIFTSVVDENIVGPSNIPQLRVDSRFVQKQRVGGIVEEIKATGLGQAIDQTLTRSFDHEYTDAANAERMSKEAGLDIKFEEGRYKKSEVSQRIENTYRKRLRDSNLAQYQSEPDPTFLNKAQIFGAAVGTGMFGTPWDTVGTAALMFAPELIVGGIAKTAGAVNTATKANAVLNASSKIARAKTSASMFRAAASNVDDTGLRTYARYRMKRNLTGSIKTPKVSPGVAKTLENLSSLKYNNLTGTEKTLLDTAVFGIGDVPIAGFKYYNDQEIGSNLYTAKDAMSEVLYAGALGAVVPGALRGVGKAIGIYPKDIAIRRINEASNEIKYKAAMGEISQEDANEALKTLDNIKKATENDAKNVKDIHPSLAQAAEELPRVNLDNDTLHTWITVIANDIAQGRGIPKISQLPQGKHAFSHIAFDFVARLKQESIGKVLGKHLLVNKTKFGSHTVTVNGETGALGGKAAFGATLEDAQTFLESLYKGFVLEDADALERAYEHYFRGQDFLDELNKIYDKYSEMRAANQEKFTYSAKKLINLEEALGDAYIKYRWGAETLEGLKAREENLKIAKEEGRAAQDATLSREDSAMQEEAKAYF